MNVCLWKNFRFFAFFVEKTYSFCSIFPFVQKLSPDFTKTFLFPTGAKTPSYPHYTLVFALFACFLLEFFVIAHFYFLNFPQFVNCVGAQPLFIHKRGGFVVQKAKFWGVYFYFSTKSCIKSLFFDNVYAPQKSAVFKSYPHFAWFSTLFCLAFPATPLKRSAF